MEKYLSFQNSFVFCENLWSWRFTSLLKHSRPTPCSKHTPTICEYCKLKKIQLSTYEFMLINLFIYFLFIFECISTNCSGKNTDFSFWFIHWFRKYVIIVLGNYLKCQIVDVLLDSLVIFLVCIHKWLYTLKWRNDNKVALYFKIILRIACDGIVEW